MHKAYEEGKFEDMLQHYQSIIEHIVEVKKYSREQFFSSIKGRSYKESQSATRVSLAEGFELVYDKVNNIHCCLGSG